jgi:hypothetical protein
MSEKQIKANVIKVTVTGNPGAYTFSVTVKSPDTGPDQYADWWEVLSSNGRLLYRRILLHSHVDEQPFTRSGGPVPIGPHDAVFVRAHMSTAGYGGVAFHGSVAQGFVETELPSDFAADVELLEPQPEDCAF